MLDSLPALIVRLSEEVGRDTGVAIGWKRGREMRTAGGGRRVSKESRV